MQISRTEVIYYFSSFRDSTYTDGEEGRDPATGNIEHIFDGINRDLLSLAAGGHLADSEGDNGDVELEDEDSVGDERYNSSSQNLSSFRKGAPALAGRGGEGSRPPGSRSRSRGGEGERPRRSKADKDKHKVGQLDERNLKKAAHRYGTLPKGARIGAYLESMRVSGLTPEPASDDTDTLDSHKSGATDPGHRSSPAAAAEMMTPAMARSNSSHGGFPGSGAAARHQQQQVPRRLQTYTQSSVVASPSSPRSKHSNALHELDFPPPPPAELPASAADADMQRRKSRDPSSDSCGDSVRSYSDSASLRLNCVSPVVAAVSPGPATHQHQLLQEMARPGAATPPLPASSPLPPPASPPPSGDPASQLVSELFESIKLKSDDRQTSSKPPQGPNRHQKEAKPAVQDFKAGLRKVNQHPLSQEKQDSGSSSQINFKSQLKKTNSSLYAQPSTQPAAQEEEESCQEPGRVDFKSQLKKVKSSKGSEAAPGETQDSGQDLSSVKASLRSVSKQSVQLEEEEAEAEDKRKSTGSISSLKKMWEDGGEAGGAREAGDDRPASVVKFEKRVWPPVPSTETEKPMVPVKPTVKPPPTSKPPPPKEPSCKPPPKPSPMAKPMVCNIYAAPTSLGPTPKPNISAAKPKPKVSSAGATKEQQQQEQKTVPHSKAKTNNGTTASARADSTDSGLSSSNDKDTVVDLSVSLENLLGSLSKEGITKASAMSASDKVGCLYTAEIIHRHLNVSGQRLSNFHKHLSTKQKLSKYYSHSWNNIL